MLTREATAVCLFFSNRFGEKRKREKSFFDFCVSSLFCFLIHTCTIKQNQSTNSFRKKRAENGKSRVSFEYLRDAFGVCGNELKLKFTGGGKIRREEGAPSYLKEEG